MFEFLKSTVSHIANVATPEYLTIAKIHDDFDTASQKAVDEANEILKAISNPDIKKQVDVLVATGFNNVPLVTEWNKEHNKRMQAENTVSIVDKYTQKYPGQKFIFIEQVKEICKKYNLLCVPVGKYKGEVPHKNVLEIAAFKARPEDTYLEEGSWRDRIEFNFSDRNRFKNSEEVKKIRNEYPQRFNALDTYDRFSRMPSYSLPSSFSSVPLFICAPKGDIIMDKEDKVSNEVFMTREIKDPIVLHYVGDGFLVVTKWGLEGGDSSLVNEKMN